MSKCSQCRKWDKELDTTWDRVRLWFFHRFSQDIIDLSQDKFTQGVGDGYKLGYEHAKNQYQYAKPQVMVVKQDSGLDVEIGGPGTSNSGQASRWENTDPSW